jgi:hypothetical protein
MNCYRHQDQPAVAVCKNCGKATCPECCGETARGIACSEQCTLELLEAAELEAGIRKNLGVGADLPMPSTVPTYFFFGLILVTTGVYLSFTRPGIDFITFAMAAAFFVMSGISYKRYRHSCKTC